jgi:sulfate adenylyltransferase subunit 1
MSLLGEIERNALDDLGVLRFITAGSVDDGKSTLIGRLLHDSRAILADQLAAVSRASAKRGQDAPDLSLLTDGLEAEREQGITIDVAYRYFATPRRKFIIADTPGHEQYTRNMVTGASTADVAIILIDARKGVLTQTRRHTYIAHLLGIRHIFVAVNKMDLAGFSKERFEAIRADFLSFSSTLGIPDLRFFPLSALAGDMVVDRGEALAWYQGQTLLEALEAVEVADAPDFALRFPVQLVVRPGAGSDFRGYAGRLESGVLKPGTNVTVLPSGRSSSVTRISVLDEALDEARAGDAVTIELADDIDISRGDMITDASHPPRAAKQLDADLCWLATEPMSGSGRYLLKHGTRIVKAKIAAVAHKIDINTLERQPSPSGLAMNDIARVSITLAQPVFADAYLANRGTGAFILIDEATNQTVAAGMIA